LKRKERKIYPYPDALIKKAQHYENFFFSVNWRFLMEVLHAMKFPEKFVQWIQCGITSPMLEVAINGGLV